MPFQIYPSNPVSVKFTTTLPKNPKFNMKSIFSDNSRVCYKPHTYTVRAGTVRNASTTAKRT
jgi:hypothetical protein